MKRNSCPLLHVHNDDVIGKEAEYFGKIQSVSFKELSQMNRFMDELTVNDGMFIRLRISDGHHDFFLVVEMHLNVCQQLMD